MVACDPAGSASQAQASRRFSDGGRSIQPNGC
jgi:hypothetical protein